MSAETQAGKWVIAKEIAVGSIPLIMAIVSFGGLLYGNQRAMESAQRAMEVRIEQLERADIRQQDAAAAQRAELLSGIAKLGTQMEIVQREVARLVARSDDAAARRVPAMPDDSRRGNTR